MIEMQMPLSNIPRRIIDWIQRKHVRSILEIRLKHLDSTFYAKINTHCIRLFVAVLTDPENENWYCICNQEMGYKLLIKCQDLTFKNWHHKI